MQQEGKLSRFMFHIKFSSTENYLNEHELYEVMRSRNLYQNQFGVKLNFRKIMRNIEIAEKAERYGFENTRKLFVQRMRERREQADKLRLITSSLRPAGFGERRTKKRERRYVPIPQSTTIYSEFPAIVQMQQANSPPVSVLSAKSRDRASSKMSLPIPPTPSVIAATLLTDDIEHRENDFSPMKAFCQDQETHLLPTKAVVASRGSPTSVVKTPLAKDNAGQLFPVLPELQRKGSMVMKQPEPCNGSTEGLNKDQEEFVKKTKRGRGKMHVSTARLTDGPSDEQTRKKTAHSHSDSTEKCEQWREKHGLVSKDPLESNSYARRLMIDRPSKFTLSHVNDERLLDAVDLRYRMIQKIAKELNNNNQPGKVSEKMDSKTNNYVSLPELDAVPKPMVTMDPGGTTPDGRLILTKADYEEYLAAYRRAREARLKRAKKHEQAVGKRVDEFKVAPSLHLREPSRLPDGLILRAL